MAKRVGFGSVLGYSSSTGFVSIGQVRNFDGPAGTGTDVDVTTLDESTNFRAFSRGPVDPGELTMTLAYDPSVGSHQNLGTLYSSGDTKTWTVFHGSSTGGAVNTAAFSGYVSAMGRANPLDDLVTVDVTIKVTGDPDYQTT